MKVYSSDIDIDVSGSNQNRASHLFKVIYDIEYWIIHSRDSFKNADSSSNEISEVFMSESLNHSFKPLFHNFNIKDWCIKYILNTYVKMFNN